MHIERAQTKSRRVVKFCLDECLPCTNGNNMYFNGYWTALPKNTINLYCYDKSVD